MILAVPFEVSLRIAGTYVFCNVKRMIKGFGGAPPSTNSQTLNVQDLFITLMHAPPNGVPKWASFGKQNWRWGMNLTIEKGA